MVIQAPEENYSLRNERNVKLFLAGGITNCPDWQREVIDSLKIVRGLTIFNPRRENFDTSNPNESERQIIWEHRHLEESDIISFWFSRGSLNPIVLYELGKYITNMNKRIVIGVDEEYERKNDVFLQTQLIRKIAIHTELDIFTNEIVNEYRKITKEEWNNI